jgi:4-hydroxythreonine-4-phosphate dehydrogenase
MPPLIAITTGEPAGIGPEIALAAVADGPLRDVCRPVLIGDGRMLATRARAVGVALPLVSYRRDQAPPKGAVEVLDVALVAPVVAGHLDAAHVPAVLQMLERAIAGALSGEFQAVVTAPVQKSIIHQAGVAFIGHTEFFAERSGVKQVVMMLAGGGLRVALATTHLPLSAVAAALTSESLETTLRILVADLSRWFGIARPRILVAGLNPHAGEDGVLGSEEVLIIKPVLQRLRAEGLDVLGPLPADTLFQPVRLAQADAVLAMYHDQGLPVLKYASFGSGVNITLGLPIIRTSVDHGTALDLAGTGRAEAGSMRAAISMALQMHAARG